MATGASRGSATNCSSPCGSVSLIASNTGRQGAPRMDTPCGQYRLGYTRYCWLMCRLWQPEYPAGQTVKARFNGDRTKEPERTIPQSAYEMTFGAFFQEEPQEQNKYNQTLAVRLILSRFGKKCIEHKITSVARQLVSSAPPLLRQATSFGFRMQQ